MANLSYFQYMTRSVAAFLCTLSLWSSPTRVQAACCEDACCDGGWWSGGSTALIIGGAAVAGGIAGAIAGNSNSHKGKRGHTGHEGQRGPQGPVGPAGPAGATGATGPSGSSFIPDIGQSITFNMSLAVVSLIGTGEITPFVERPDGVVVEGPSLPLGLLNLPVIPPIVIDNPIFGTYHFGVRISSEDLVTIGLDIAGIVAASRDASVTNAGVLPVTPIINSALFSNQAQTTFHFTYDNLTIP